MRWLAERLIPQATLCCVVLTAGCASNPPAGPSRPGTAFVEQAQVPRNVDATEVDDDVVEPPPVGPGGQKPTLLASVGGMLDRAQQGATARFGAFMFELDDFFAGGHETDEPNTSFLRFRLDAAKPALDGFELDPTVKLRVVLPRAEQRFRLLFSTEDDPENRSEEVEQVAGLADDQSLSLALRFARSLADTVDLDFDLGTRTRDGGLQIFGRINTEYRQNFLERWQFRFENRYFYYSKSGYEDRIRLDFIRQVGLLEDPRRRFFRSSTTIDWRETRDAAVIGQTLGLYLDLEHKSALAIEGIASYYTELEEDINDRYRGAEFRIRYRRNLWRPYLYVELWPGVAWPADREYRPTFTGLARVEVTIGGEALVPLQQGNP